jgi:hypothetical protein
MRFLLASIIFISAVCQADAQQNVKHDSSVVAVRQFSSASLAEYKKQREFQYDKIYEPPKSLWDRFLNWLFSWLAKLFSGLARGSVVSWIVTVVLAALVVYFILKILGMTDAGLFGKKSAKKIEYTVDDEDIHSINFDEAIQRAIDNKNFRLAVRLLYLQILKNLTDKGIINWQINKTNLHYLHELKDKDYQPGFRQLTRQFESNWYGNMPVAESDFGQLKQLFADFNKQL